jgi:hypothetical protein
MMSEILKARHFHQPCNIIPFLNWTGSKFRVIYEKTDYYVSVSYHQVVNTHTKHVRIRLVTLTGFSKTSHTIFQMQV